MSEGSLSFRMRVDVPQIFERVKNNIHFTIKTLFNNDLMGEKSDALVILINPQLQLF